MPSPTERSFTKRTPLMPPLGSPSRRHPIGGMAKEIFSPLQSNVSCGRSTGGAGAAEGAGLELHAGLPISTTATNARPMASEAARIGSLIGIPDRDLRLHM